MHVLHASIDADDQVVAETSFSSMQRWKGTRSCLVATMQNQTGGRRASFDCECVAAGSGQVPSGKAGGFLHELDPKSIKFCNDVMLEMLTWS